MGQIPKAMTAFSLLMLFVFSGAGVISMSLDAYAAERFCEYAAYTLEVSAFSEEETQRLKTEAVKKNYELTVTKQDTDTDGTYDKAMVKTVYQLSFPMFRMYGQKHTACSYAG